MGTLDEDHPNQDQVNGAASCGGKQGAEHCKDSDQVDPLMADPQDHSEAVLNTTRDKCGVDSCDQSISIHATLLMADSNADAGAMDSLGELPADDSLDIDIVFEWATTGKVRRLFTNPHLSSSLAQVVFAQGLARA
jgi:hypothetical protein